MLHCLCREPDREPNSGYIISSSSQIYIAFSN